MEQKDGTVAYLATIEQKVPEEELKVWRYQEKLWEKNILANQDGEYDNPYELRKEKGDQRPTSSLHDAMLTLHSAY